MAAYVCRIVMERNSALIFTISISCKNTVNMLVPIFCIVTPQSENYFQTVRFTFAFHRAELVGKHSSLPMSIPRRGNRLIGAFFNGVFLLALALSIFLQSLERFVHVERIEKPFSVLVIGCIGLTLNIISALVIHGILFLVLDIQLC